MREQLNNAETVGAKNSGQRPMDYTVILQPSIDSIMIKPEVLYPPTYLQVLPLPQYISKSRS
jgi:hypothetical protein